MQRGWAKPEAGTCVREGAVRPVAVVTLLNASFLAAAMRSALQCAELPNFLIHPHTSTMSSERGSDRGRSLQSESLTDQQGMETGLAPRNLALDLEPLASSVSLGAHSSRY